MGGAFARHLLTERISVIGFDIDPKRRAPERGRIDLDRFGITGNTRTLLSRLQWIY